MNGTPSVAKRYGRRVLAGAGCCAAALLATPQLPQQPVVRVGTRLVQLDVAVRDKNGPVLGLTKDDFTVLDQGKPERITLFMAPSLATPAASSAPLPPGSVSNRTDRSGAPLRGSTVLLIDLLNTSFDDQGYVKAGATKLLQSLQENERFAIYVLGKQLAILQDFTDDPGKLAEAIRKIGPDLMLLIPNMENADKTDRDAEDMSSPIYAQIRAQITGQAVASIAAHLSGVTGRKNVIWLSDQPRTIPGQNVAVYPVLPHAIGSSGVFAWSRDTREALGRGINAPAFIGPGQALARERAAAALGASTGGAAFNDAKDLMRALHRAEEDTSESYTIGYYPAQDSLDGKFHNFTVKLARDKAKGKAALEIAYRPGYLATQAAPQARAGDFHALLTSPLDATGIGLIAHVTNSQALLTVDLHDIHFERVNDRLVASLLLSQSAAPYETARTQPVRLELTEAQYTAALEHGFELKQPLPAETGAPGFGIVVRDQATGIAGSVHLPLPGK